SVAAANLVRGTVAFPPSLSTLMCFPSSSRRGHPVSGCTTIKGLLGDRGLPLIECARLNRTQRRRFWLARPRLPDRFWPPGRFWPPCLPAALATGGAPLVVAVSSSLDAAGCFLRVSTGLAPGFGAFCARCSSLACFLASSSFAMRPKTRCCCP